MIDKERDFKNTLQELTDYVDSIKGDLVPTQFNIVDFSPSEGYDFDLATIRFKILQGNLEENNGSFTSSSIVVVELIVIDEHIVESESLIRKTEIAMTKGIVE